MTLQSETGSTCAMSEIGQQQSNGGTPVSGMHYCMISIELSVAFGR